MKSIFIVRADLSIDWQRGHLYFTNEDVAVAGGALYSWHRIEVVDVDGSNRKVVISDVEKPRGLFLDLYARYEANESAICILRHKTVLFSSLVNDDASVCMLFLELATNIQFKSLHTPFRSFAQRFFSQSLL